LLRLLLGVCVLVALSGAGLSDQPLEIKIGYLRQAPSRIKISLIDVPAANDGLAGAQLAIEDDNTTGRFLNQHYTLVETLLGEGDDPVAAMNALADQGASFIVTSLDADRLLKTADAGKARGEMLINASALDERLREQDCRANVIHVAPTRSMLADALAQYLVWKKWSKWMLLTGSHEKDVLFAEALRHAATRFGAKIVEQREFKDSGGARRTDSGVTEIQRQMPVVTQGAPQHDVLVAADESEVFAGYLPYRTWDARPVVGSAGLVPSTWNAAFDQWGAVQLQNRFIKAFQRSMTASDMQVWTAVRMIGEAAARTNSSDAGKMQAYIKSPEFSVAAFKGQKLTIRDWNLQLRQPILLFDGRNTVSVSPQEGFLHQSSALDTLGLDRPETKCKLQ
jgi:ABC transporter substrate binding protein (PQQ-dependent alcohol dehydrogenase system)